MINDNGKICKRTLKTSVFVSVGITLIATTLIFIFFGVPYSVKKEYKNNMLEYSYILNHSNKEVLLTPKEKYIKYTTWYYQLMGWYGWKPQSPKGMTRWQKTQICQKSYKYEKMIGLPHCFFKPLGFIESNFNPNCQGKIGEVGYLQIHRQAAGQALIFLADMKKVRPDLYAELIFTYSKKEDLFNPLTSLKITAVRAWGLNRMYKGNLVWVVSTLHWGLSRMWPLYKSEGLPKEIWKFYTRKKGKLEISSIRNPLMYYYIWSEINNAWSNFRKDINNESIDYMKKYMEQSFEEKRQWIHSWRYVIKLKYSLEEVVKQKEILSEKVLKAEKIIKETEKMYRKIYKKKKTKWNKAENIFRIFKNKIKKIKTRL